MSKVTKTSSVESNLNNYLGHRLLENHYNDLELHKQAFENKVVQDHIYKNGSIDKATFRLIRAHMIVLRHLISASPFLHEKFFGSINEVKIKNSGMDGSYASYRFYQIDGDSLHILIVKVKTENILSNFNITVCRKLISDKEETYTDFDTCKEMERTLKKLGRQWLKTQLEYIQ